VSRVDGGGGGSGHREGRIYGGTGVRVRKVGPGGVGSRDILFHRWP
jgi:hypothetical protein